MKSLWCVLVLGVAVSGCDQQQSGTLEEYAMADGAVIVRQLAPEQNNVPGAVPGFEIVVREPGWIHVGVDLDRGGIGMQVTDAPSVFHLQVPRTEYKSQQVLDQFVAPLFGADAAERLRNHDPEHTLHRTTIVVSHRDDGMSTASAPIITRMPGPAAWYYASGLGSLNGTDDTVRLATWVHVPTSAERRTGVSLGDGVRISIDGAQVTAEEAGAAVYNLMLRYSPAQPRASAVP